ncbi:hypothetical protein ACO2Q0_19280 [Phenylobacterium sp. VNQ135]|uniref:hypothetical protein n=1 Tax=Phenylobacterium sp. VNQ135 TaxID=3400922 RepID=UPI003BFBD45D
MLSDADMLQEMDAGLAHVASLQLALADKLHGMAQAAEEASEVADLAKALEGVSRSLRLTYALRVKLRKDVRSLDREETRRAEAAEEKEAERPWNRIRNTVQTLTWREADWEEDEEVNAELEGLLAYEALDPNFIHLPLEQQVDRIIRKLGLTAAPYPSPQGEGDREAVEGAEAHFAFQSSA